MGLPDTPQELKARALRHLGRREHSLSELARKLAPHAASAEALAALLDELVSRRQLSDERYAGERVRVLSRKYGAARIRRDLLAKGIAGELVEAISTEGELERARAILARKYRAAASTPQERAKRARFLQGRGFSTDVINRLLRLRVDDDQSVAHTLDYEADRTTTRTESRSSRSTRD